MELYIQRCGTCSRLVVSCLKSFLRSVQCLPLLSQLCHRSLNQCYSFFKLPVSYFKLFAQLCLQLFLFLGFLISFCYTLVFFCKKLLRKPRTNQIALPDLWRKSKSWSTIQQICYIQRFLRLLPSSPSPCFALFLGFLKALVSDLT